MNTRQCLVCNKSFHPGNQQLNRGQGIFCSIKCRSQHIKGNMHHGWKGGLAPVKCIGCGDVFLIEPSRIKHGRGKFCSRACAGKWRSIHIVGKSAYGYKNNTCIVKCIKCGKEVKKRKSLISGYKNSFCSNKCRLDWQIKENNPNWNGGVSTESKLIRESVNGVEWKKSVFKRDNYTCQECGQIGLILNAHHIKPFAKFPEYRFDISNGITLCKQCHKRKHAKHF